MAALRVPLLARERLCNSASLYEAGPCQALVEGQRPCGPGPVPSVSRTRPSHRGARAGPAPPVESEPRLPPSPAAWALERSRMSLSSGRRNPVAGGRHGVVEQQVTALVPRALAERSRRVEPHPGPAVPGAPAVPSAGVTPGPSPAPGALRCAAQVAPEPGSWGTATAGAPPLLGLCAAGVTRGRDREAPQCRTEGRFEVRQVNLAWLY